MANAKQILLVEGDADKSFFQKMCKNLSLDTSVQVAPPKDLSGTHNSKQGVFQQLALLLPQLNDGELTHVGAVVDADYLTQHGLGYQKTIDKITAIVQPFGFELDQGAQSGVCFSHADGLADVGLWIMPNNQHEGMLEDWIKSCVNDNEQALFQQAVAAVQHIHSPKFSVHLSSKAEVATWLAWQKQPGHGLYATLKEPLLNNEHPWFKELEQWLLNVFPKDVAQ